MDQDDNINNASDLLKDINDKTLENTILDLSDGDKNVFFFKIMKVSSFEFDVQEIGLEKDKMVSFKIHQRNLRKHVKSLRDKINNYSISFCLKHSKKIKVNLQDDELAFYLDEKKKFHFKSDPIELPSNYYGEISIQHAVNKQIGIIKRAKTIREKKEKKKNDAKQPIKSFSESVKERVEKKLAELELTDSSMEIEIKNYRDNNNKRKRKKI